MLLLLVDLSWRLGAVWLAAGMARKLRLGLRERRVVWLAADVPANWPRHGAARDAAPARYGLEIGFQGLLLMSCLFVALFGRGVLAG